MKNGVSICIVTLDSFFYNRLALEMIRRFTHLVQYEVLVFDGGSKDGSREWLGEQGDVKLVGGKENIGHGKALDVLIKCAQYNVCCTLCSDAFPTSHEWLVPAFSLFDGKTMLAGADKGWGRLLKHYICPSYLMGQTEFLRQHSFDHNWPKWDTGEMVSKKVEEMGGQFKFIEMKYDDFGGKFKPKPCNYSGLVWHKWFSTRIKVYDVSHECEPEYHNFVIKWLRDRYSLTF